MPSPLLVWRSSNDGQLSATSAVQLHGNHTEFRLVFSRWRRRRSLSCNELPEPPTMFESLEAAKEYAETLEAQLRKEAGFR